MDQPSNPLNGIQKAAVLLVTLGPQESAAILKHIPSAEANLLARGVAQLNRIPAHLVSDTLEEFSRYSASQQLYLTGGMEYAEKMLAEAYGPEAARGLLDRLANSLGKDGFNFASVRKADPQQLAKLIQDEHPQTIALVLSHFDPSQAATLLSSLPPETRMEVAIRIADLDQISPEIVRNIAFVIDNKLRNLGELSREACGGVRAVANIFNRLDPNTCVQLMEAIEQNKPPLFENIKRLMFVFRDLEKLESAALVAILSRAARSTLIVALKGANESLRQKFLATQSQRGAAMMAEELASLGPVKLREVDAAQQEIVTLAREMEKEGVISLQGSSDEQYVY
ncbi:MAG TPA: flagellar motor switch protein FliG [Bryobacteraceae bacterium]|nr:flagellar motor switch protein FliG [Bryobacteraceae bacterium]